MHQHSTIPFRLWYLIYFAGMGLFVPRMSPFVFRDLAPPDPGLLFLISQIALPLVSLLAGYISDVTLKTRRIIAILLVIASFSVFYLATALPHSQIISTVFFSLFIAGMAGVLPLVNISFLQNRRDAHFYGHTRLFGTLGFLLPNLLFSFIPIERPLLIQLSGVFFLLSLAILPFLPSSRPIEHDSDAISLREMRRLLHSPIFLFFLILMFIYFFQYSPAEYIISNFIVAQSGTMPDFLPDPVSLAWMLGTGIEILFFLASPWIISLRGELFLIIISFIAGIARYAFILLFPGGIALVLIQSLHGLHFGPAYVGSVLYVKHKAHPQRLGTAQALLLVVSRALGTGLGGFTLGNLANRGYTTEVFWVSLVSAMFGLLVLILYMRREKQRDHFIVAKGAG